MTVLPCKLGALLFFFWIFGCHPSSLETKQNKNINIHPTATRGRAIYQTQCTACHHSNSRKNGVIGPDVYGSSQAVIQSHILGEKNPLGYEPKAPQQKMPPLPHLKDEIESLFLYLNEP